MAKLAYNMDKGEVHLCTISGTSLIYDTFTKEEGVISDPLKLLDTSLAPHLFPTAASASFL